MKRSMVWRRRGLAILAGALVLGLPACEVNVGSSSDTASGSGNIAPIPTPTPAPTPTPNPNPNPNPNPDPDPDPDPVTTPGVPMALSPGDGDPYSGAGAKVTLVWTDAEGAARFEVVIQGLGSGGWQGLVGKVTDGFQYVYTLNSQPYTQFRWAVRSLSAANVPSAFTSWSSFTWAP